MGPEPVRAADGDYLTLGNLNDCVFQTDLDSAAGIGLRVRATNTNATAIHGLAKVGAGHGVLGSSDSPTGIGVGGTCDGGTAVKGQATSGTGVHAVATTGVALKATGKVQFSRSGKTKILSGRSTKKITLAGVTTSSLVFAVLASNRSGRYVRAVVSSGGYFTIYLNASLSSDAYVSWFVVN